VLVRLVGGAEPAGALHHGIDERALKANPVTAAPGVPPFGGDNDAGPRPTGHRLIHGKMVEQ
jgi:hypothetical protein